jgi:hypothetical protein
VSRIESIVLPWASSIDIDETKLKESGFTGSRLFVTTRFGGRQQDDLFISRISPDIQPSPDSLGEQTVVVTAVKENKSGDAAKPSRILVAGDSEFLSDQFAVSTPTNIAFGMAAFSWLGQEESLAGLQIKQKPERRLRFENQKQIMLIKYGNLALALLLPTAFGIFRLARRRSLRKFAYSHAYE